MRVFVLLGLFVLAHAVNNARRCEVSHEFVCSRQRIKNCAKSENIKEIRKYCSVKKEHEKLIGDLEKLFGDNFGPSRPKRTLQQLNEGFVKTDNFEAEASCSIGGGTIMSFDGYSHTITGGPCTYVLIADKTIAKIVVFGTFSSHAGGKFANKLTNVAIFFGRESLVLGEGFDINYQGIGYNTPAIISDKLTVWRDEYYIYAESPEIGGRIRWDPEGQLKISLGPGYVNQILGLCGYYNNDASVEAEHNSIKYSTGSGLLNSNEYSTTWAVSGCYHLEEYLLERRLQECDSYIYSRICSISHAAPELSSCLRDNAYGKRYQQECITNMCLCNDLSACLYTETLRISNDCYDRLGLKIENQVLKSYFNQDFIQRLIPDPYSEVPTETGVPGRPKQSNAPDIHFQFKPAAQCYIYGHSHVHTFDGVDYRTGAHGCSYPLAFKETIQDFAVYGTFRPQSPSGKLASSLTYVSFFDLKNRIRIQLGQGLEINYEGKAIKTPYNKEYVSIWYDDERHYVYVYDADIGVELRWDGESSLRISLTDMYEGTTKGLCGTFNRDQSDEINSLAESPVKVSDFQVMVQSWELPSCSHDNNVYSAGDTCRPSNEDTFACADALTMVELAFCVTDLPPILFIERCEQDLCRCDDDDECRCQIVSAYTQICEDLIDTSLVWRSDSFCPRNMCLFNRNGCQHGCIAPGDCKCDPGFELAADGKSCLVTILV